MAGVARETKVMAGGRRAQRVGAPEVKGHRRGGSEKVETACGSSSVRCKLVNCLQSHSRPCSLYSGRDEASQPRAPDPHFTRRGLDMISTLYTDTTECFTSLLVLLLLSPRPSSVSQVPPLPSCAQSCGILNIPPSLTSSATSPPTFSVSSTILFTNSSLNAVEVLE